jgi:hypothetical protein
MKNILIIAFLITILVGCRKETSIVPKVKINATQELKINSTTGIKLQSSFVTTEVLMNAKLEKDDKAVIKIFDISNRVVSKEEVSVTSGDNILKVYTSALPQSAYRIALYGSNGVMLGITDFNKL